jgi:hypothetical protein
MTNALRMPGFTAEAALYTAGRNYRTTGGTSTGGTSTAPGANPLTPATRKNGTLEWIDCNDFPANNWCRECGNTGPDAAVCCPDDYCVVIDKTPFEPPTRGRWSDMLGATRFARR